MVLEEWPIAVEPADPMVDSAHARSPSRLDTVRRDFFLDPRDRLTEQERALMTAMLHDLLRSLITAIRAAAGDVGEAPEPARIAATLGKAGLLDRPGLLRLMLRRADEQRIFTAFAGHAGPRRLPLLPSLVADSDPAIAGAAMALVVARGRRRDGFGRPRIDLGDLDSRDVRALAQAVAVALNADVQADARFAAAASNVVDAIDPAVSLDCAVEALVEALDRAGRADEILVETASGEGEIALVATLTARRAGISQRAVWDHLVNRGEGGLALVARMAGLGRRSAARLIADFGSTGNWSIEEEIARYDALGFDEVAAALRHWQLPADYRAAVEALGNRRG